MIETARPADGGSRPVTRAEWLEGIPPVSISTDGRHRRWTISSISSFESWAKPQAASPQASTLLSSSSWRTAWDDVVSIIGRGW